MYVSCLCTFVGRGAQGFMNSHNRNAFLLTGDFSTKSQRRLSSSEGMRSKAKVVKQYHKNSHKFLNFVKLEG